MYFGLGVARVRGTWRQRLMAAEVGVPAPDWAGEPDAIASATGWVSSLMGTSTSDSTSHP